MGAEYILFSDFLGGSKTREVTPSPAIGWREESGHTEEGHYQHEGFGGHASSWHTRNEAAEGLAREKKQNKTDVVRH